MRGRVGLVISAAILGAGAGCTSINPDARVGEAIDLVEQNTGQRPDWKTMWDQDSASWDGQEVLALEDALVLALRNNRELRADLETIGQANADLVQATLFSNPAIDFMIMFPDGGGRSMLRGNGLPMQPLQDLWLIPAREKVGQAELRRVVLRVADRAVEVVAAVKAVYARLQYTRRAIELIQENMRIVEQTTRVIEVRQVGGQATQVEVNLSQIRWMRLRSDLLAMQSQHQAFKRQLLLLMGVAAARAGWEVEPLRELEYALEPPPDEEFLLALADEQRLDLQATEWMVQGAQKRVQLRRREGWPDLALGLSFQREAAPRSQNPSLAGQFGNAVAQGVANGVTGMGGGGGPMVAPFNPKPRDMTAMIGPMVAMELPIFDWGQAQTARAVHEYLQSVAQYEALAQEIIRAVRENLVTYAQAYEQVQYYRESIIPAVDRNLEIAQQSYVAGREEITVFLNVQEDLISMRLRILEFLRDYLVIQAELERQVGGRLAAPAPSTQPATTPADEPGSGAST
ncbi:MAG: hypothetical protein AMXMBFR13_08930 [Phycisphaerae bacterium]